MSEELKPKELKTKSDATEPARESQCVILIKRYRRCEARNDTLGASRAWDEIWELCGNRINAYLKLHKFILPNQRREDIIDEVKIGVLRAVREWDPGRGTTFLHCAFFMAQSQLLHQLGKFNEAICQPDYILIARKVLSKLQKSLEGSLGREPTEEDEIGRAHV